MTIYHISKDGNPKVCRASKDNCPLGGDHFTSLVDARTSAELKLAQESEELPVDRILEDTFSVMQRRRMFQRNPKMNLSVAVGTVVVSSSGDLWQITKKIDGETAYDAQLQLRNRRSGKFVNARVSKGEENKGVARDVSEFSLLTPQAFTIDGPPKHDNKKFKPFTANTQDLENVLLMKIRVETVDHKLDDISPSYGAVGFGDNERWERLPSPEHYRYLAVYPANEASLMDKKLRSELSLAIWKQAGRDEDSWNLLDKVEKDDLVRNSHGVGNSRFTVRNERVRFENLTLERNQFDSFLPPSYMSQENLCGYDLASQN